MASSERVLKAPLSRRDVLAGGTCAAAALFSRAPDLLAEEEVTPQYQDALKSFLAGRTLAADAGITLVLPELAENGNMVPFSVSAESPMSEEDHVRSITLFSTGNPQPVIATFQLTPASGRAAVSGRLRLARSQDVIAIAQTSTGALMTGRANVKVTIGGCGAG